ncbi:MAG: protein translocase subunit SecF [Gammaproteobacteria bacterium]|nr:protein translocase subunit SecF [Gammaproteobacteria bacterium]
MELFRHDTRIDFIRHRRIAYALSAIVMIACVVTLLVRGLAFGIDFTGGLLLEVGYAQPVDLGEVRAGLGRAGIEGALVQHLGSSSDVLIRVPPGEDATRADVGDQVMRALREGTERTIDLRRVEFVGPQVGQELVENGVLAVLIALGAILVYIWLRFERRLAIGAVAATVHDPVLILGFFALTGMDFDLSVVAAILAVIGYSVNDTIVVFDRIRENFRRMRRGSPAEIINTSVNQTLSRTIMTSGTTLLVVVALWIFGGPPLRGFSVALFLGILVGTYSSIYVASATALDLGLNRADMLPPQPETGEPPERP